MVHQEFRTWTESRIATQTLSSPIAALAYRSRAVVPPSSLELERILRLAQERNRAEGLTGLLIYDQGCFYQWLEGPRLGLLRVWQSIQRDARHADLKILRQETIAGRFFKGWDMRLAHRTRGDLDKIVATMAAPQDLLSRLRVQPAVLTPGMWDRVFDDAVIPRLRAVHDTPADPEQVAKATQQPFRGLASVTNLRESRPHVTAPGAIWHARDGAAAQLAGILMAMDSGDTARFVDDLVEQGAGLEPLFHEIFEPAARFLGGLWEEDQCSEFTVGLAMGLLQLEARRISGTFAPLDYVVHPGHAILVAAQPGESHGLAAAMSSELFGRDGWDVSCESPSSNEVLRNLLHEQWFDVLELSLSGALRRDQQLPAMRLTIRAARAASLNPALAVIVEGRSFFDRPRAYLDVGADRACSTVIESVPAAQELVAAATSRISSFG